ncbi:MAG: hypothetical protein ABEJ26_07630 [Halosimplex sp.]
MSRRGFELGTRGRVPFALVGVLLVLSSALFASAVDRPRPASEPAVDLAVERTTADARAAVRSAVVDASVAAASDPVLAPANNAWGDLLDPGTAFRDALRIRIYRAARARLGAVARTHRGVRANVTLPAARTPEALAAAMERVRVERTGPDGANLRATLENVTVRATRGGRVVGAERVSFTVVVATPVLAVHDRVERFQERLTAGVAKPGLGQRLTARLYAVAWARGYAQYGGAPIDNVVANRYVELVTNGGVLGVQRSVFGRSDPDGRRALATATAAVGLSEVLSAGGTGDPGVDALLQQRLTAARSPTERAGLPGVARTGSEAPAPNETVDVAVGLSADRAFRELLRDGAINRTIDSVYSARVRTLASVDRADGGAPPRPEPPAGDGWTLRAETNATTVIGVSNATGGPDVSVPDGYHRLATYTRTVDVRHERRAVWVRNASVDETTRTRTETKRVTVAVVGRHAVSPYAPDRPIPSVHERGGPFDGPNLADVAMGARRAVVAPAGGPDGLARTAATGSLDDSPETVHGEWPDEMSPWIYRGLVDLRKTVRNESVSVSRGRLGTHEARPATELAARLRDRRSALVDAPETYGSVAAKARAAVRGRYLDLVLDRLAERAADRSKRERSLADALERVDGPSLSRLRTSYDARRASERGSDGGGGSTAAGHVGTDRSGGLEFHVDGAPPYLTTAAVEAGQVAAVEGDDAPTHPLTARNVDYVTVPYGDATEAVLTALLPGGSSRKRRLVTAARALRAANATLDHRPNATVEERRDRLAEEVDSTVESVRGELSSALRERAVGNSSAQRERVVDEVLSRWDSLDARALALSNGSVVAPLVAAAEERAAGDGWSVRRRDRIRLRLRTALYDALEAKRGKVSGPAVTGATARVKDAVRERVRSEVSGVFEKRFNESVAEIPAGLPLAPPLGEWVATMNVWSVTVRGQYARFAVETPRRTPGAGDASLQYVRDGENATLDLDGDGESEILGRASRVTFTARTAVVVVVPAGGTGVGDVDGVAIEESQGWPIPGPDDRTRPWTGERYPLNATDQG